MNRALTVIVPLSIVGVLAISLYRGGVTTVPRFSAPEKGHQSPPSLLSSSLRLSQTKAEPATHQDPDQLTSHLSHPDMTSQTQQMQKTSLDRVVFSSLPKSASTAPPFTKIFDDGGPSIGSIKVLGHAGCNANTQGWFLSVGNPEQYDFTISEDGDSVFVEPNTPNLSGNFELVHCVAPSSVEGKHVRFTVWLKADGVTAQESDQLARIRFLGFDNWGKKFFDGVDCKGTYDWKEFSMETEVAPEVSVFSYGVSFRSTGKLWISHPKFGIIPSQ